MVLHRRSSRQTEGLGLPSWFKRADRRVSSQLSEVSFDRDDDFVRHVCDHLSSRFDQATAQETGDVPVKSLRALNHW